MNHMVAVGFLLGVMLVGPPAFAAPLPPEPESGWQAKQAAQGRGIVAAAHPAAVQAGLAMLAKGGNAMDAVAAAQMALNVAEPQASGIGGGGFLLYYDAASGRLWAYDGRETAPAAMPENAFLDADGKSLAFLQAVRGGRSVGTPGLLRMLEAAHKAHGGLAWKELFAPAVALAQQGVPVTARLQKTIGYAAHLNGLAGFDARFRHEDGTALEVGEARANPALAKSFRQIAQGGAEAFYSGAMAQAVEEAVRHNDAAAGYLRASDLSAYTAIRRDVPCIAYRAWRICSFGAPAGGVTVLEALGMLAHYDLPGMRPLSPEAAHVLLEAEKLALADRERYMADPGFVPVPVEALLAPDYLAKRAALITPGKAMRKAEAGEFPAQAAFFGKPSGVAQERPSTTHVSVVDASGNAAALTSSIEYSFGSGLVAAGFLLNNQLTDFSFLPRDAGGQALANRIEPGKRPRSAMSPTMVFDAQGRLRLVIGSPGGVRIIPYVLQALVSVLDWQLPLQQALDAPHVLTVGSRVELEEGRGLEALGKALEAYGHNVAHVPLNSGLHAVWIAEDGAQTGAADPRRDGEAGAFAPW